MELIQEPYEYILYIDEAGDDGLKRVRPVDENGSSEWLFIGGVLTRASNEQMAVEWVKSIRSDINARQGPALHYRNLSPTKRLRACQMLADLPCRLFVVASNKKNMRGHTNHKAAKMGGRQWFYNYCVRLLMERVTQYCKARSIKQNGKTDYMRVVFSARGGHSYGQTKAYWEHLKSQAASNTTFLNKRQIAHDVLRFNLVDYYPHTQVAGLQLADIAASAFYQASDTSSSRWDIEPAKSLAPRMATEGGKIRDYGLVLQPTKPKIANLNTDQKKIFLHYGFKI